jgi:hypothetical protein
LLPPGGILTWDAPIITIDSASLQTVVDFPEDTPR